VSLLLDHGHPRAREYPISMVWDEANLVSERWNSEEITRANLLLSAISANLGKAGKSQFDKNIKQLNISVEPYED
jgi:hypothetical protein